jgi:uncharacterized protein (DUF1330 family)
MHTIRLQHTHVRGRFIVMNVREMGSSLLAAFLIVEIKEVLDETGYARYREGALPNLAAAGGFYLVGDGNVEVLEGDWRPKRMVVIRFDSAEAAHRWWDGPGYADLKAMRQCSTTTNMILVQGVPDAHH